MALDSAVWDEIKISDDQLGKVTRLRASVEKQSRQFRDTIRSQQREQQQQAQAASGTDAQANDPAAQAAARQARDEARRAAGEAMAENTAMVHQQTDAALSKILSKPKQFRRLQEIDLRAELETEGAPVFIRADIVKTLNLASDQVAQIQSIIDQTRQGQDQIDASRREMFNNMRNNGGGGGGGGRRGQNNNNNNNNNNQQSQADQQAQWAQIQSQMDQLRTNSTNLKDSSTQKAFKVLTKAQQTKFKNLLGADFNLALLNYGRGPNNNNFGPPGGFGGPGGPGGGNPAPAPSTVNNLLGTGTTSTSSSTGASTKGQTKNGTTSSARSATTKSATNR
jgi:hypothetical protein